LLAAKYRKLVSVELDEIFCNLNFYVVSDMKLGRGSNKGEKKLSVCLAN
jgi:hypothetical protein